LHQIGVANGGFYGDHDGYFPGHHTPTPVVVVWPSRLREYTGGDVDIFYCPTEPDESKWVVRTGGGSQGQERYGYGRNERVITWNTRFSYGYNDWGVKEFTIPHLGLGARPNPAHQFGPPRIEHVAAPSAMIMIGDTTTDGVWDTALDPFDDADAVGEAPSDRHYTGSANMVHPDAHVTNYPQDDLTSRTGENRSRWNNDNKPHAELSN
jgi:hypothetical protein